MKFFIGKLGRERRKFKKRRSAEVSATAGMSIIIENFITILLHFCTYYILRVSDIPICVVLLQ